ncbi:hypothetical protein AB0M46_35225 [Dactylosporangium sp. NPDC051485]|uniref:hypothetical protein n=1 Tax=Dactylosporangium sp. NPDC051485 TaxID=3154846 RepID=UPI0034363162
MRYTFLAVLAGAAATLAACSGGPTNHANPPAVPTAEQGSPPPQTGPAPLKPGASPAHGCPVDAAALEKALTANGEAAAAVQLGKGLTDVSCAQGYAAARTEGDRQVLLFQFDNAQARWAFAGIKCEQAPAAIRAQLRTCA